MDSGDLGVPADVQSPLTWSRRRKRVVITVVVVSVLLVAGLAAYIAYQQSCGLVCGPGVYPTIQGAHIHVNARWDGHCQQVSYVAVCNVQINGGDTGNVTVSVFNQNQKIGQGGNRVQFTMYSSEARYVNFTSIPPCGYASAPDFTSPSCDVPGPQAETFQFDFIVSPSYGPVSSGGTLRQPASITLVMYQTCCFP